MRRQDCTQLQRGRRIASHLPTAFVRTDHSCGCAGLMHRMVPVVSFVATHNLSIPDRCPVSVLLSSNAVIGLPSRDNSSCKFLSHRCDGGNCCITNWGFSGPSHPSIIITDRHLPKSALKKLGGQLWFCFDQFPNLSLHGLHILPMLFPALCQLCLLPGACCLCFRQALFQHRFGLEEVPVQSAGALHVTNYPGDVCSAPLAAHSRAHRTHVNSCIHARLSSCMQWAIAC